MDIHDTTTTDPSPLMPQAKQGLMYRPQQSLADPVVLVSVSPVCFPRAPATWMAPSKAAQVCPSLFWVFQNPHVITTTVAISVSVLAAAYVHTWTDTLLTGSTTEAPRSARSLGTEAASKSPDSD
jgi:hypothetical protein